ncbi:MAG: alpha/beta fold hydrolase [Candidatus Sericytochromatia bacterium]
MSPLVEKTLNYKREDVSSFIPVYQENKLTVWKVNKPVQEGKSPILMIPAMINRYYIMDISNENSLCKSLSDSGYPVYIIDWGEATPEDRWQTFTDVFLGTLRRAVSKVTKDAKEKPVLFGYCMGGAISAIYASIFTDQVKGLIGLTVPVDFSKAGVMAKWTSKKYLDPEQVVNALGNLPPEMVQSGFLSLLPAKWYRKWETVWKRQDNDKFMNNFLTIENWVNDNVPFAGGIWQEYIKWLYQENRLFNDDLFIGKYKASLKNISCPMLTIIADDDHIVPKESAEPLHTLAGSNDKTVKYFAGGHVGIITSPKLFPQLSETLHNWLKEKIDID